MNNTSSGEQPPTTTAKGFVILNPAAGDGNPERIKAILQARLGENRYDLYETTGEESLREVVQTAVQQNQYEWVASVGGDGTISQVADGLVGAEIPLAIIPAGTGNVLAEELDIPLDTEAACQILVEKPAIRHLDVMQVGQQYFLLQLGIGLEAVTMQNTSSAQKNRWGLLAYLWTAVKEALGWQPYHFTLTVDGQSYPVEASELVIANARHIGVLGLEWRDTIVPDDGRIDVAVVRARSLADYARVIWALLRGQQRQSNHIQFYTAQNELRLEAERPLPIHGDGEMLENAKTVTVVVVPGALQLFVPQAN